MKKKPVKKKKCCKHTNTKWIQQGSTGLVGYSVCLDCGYERDASMY